MSGKKHNASIIIDKPLDEVFNFSLDFNRFHLWSGAIDSKPNFQGGVREGVTFTEKYKLRGQEQEAEGVLVYLNRAEHTWAYKSSLAGYIANAIFSFDHLEGDKTLVKAEAWMEAENMMKFSIWFNLLSNFFTQRQLNQNLKDLKKLLEE